MEVKLISNNNIDEDVNKVYIACRTCYSKKQPQQLLQDATIKPLEDKLSLINKVVKSGHTSVLEHINFTFVISGVSRALLAQLSRHRHISLSVQSQRYVEYPHDLNYLKNLREQNAVGEMKNITDRYFVLTNKNENEVKYLIDSYISYLSLIEEGWDKEDARNVLPNAMKTNIVMTLNLRELEHICSVRLCTCAQLEIRKLFKELRLEVNPVWRSFLNPKCVKLGYCNEIKSCGRVKSRG